LSRAEARLVLGTAGHIDHGKTTLVRALTGVDTDRLPEEKARGITIDLGFAPLDLGDGLQLSVVDVPGHEGLVRTMVSGASGIDLALIVIAADEGVMPQTREHVAICRLLGITHGVVALTKIDLAEPDVAELAAEEAAELMAGWGLADAPIVNVSSVTGEGLEALREALREVVAVSAPRTPRSGPGRLCVDRCFASRGFGCVVTGTLVGTPFAVGDAVELYPSGLRARVRGLQHHSVARERGEPGVRCALNLQGLEVSQVSRGLVVSLPDALQPTTTLDVSLTWLDVAPETGDRVSVEFLVGTAERRAHIAPIGAAGFAPGQSGFARVHVEGEPLALLPGDRFIVRGFARTAMGGATLGGGAVLDVAPPHRRRSDPQLAAELADLSKREPATDLAVRIRRSGLAGIAADRLRRETGLCGEELAAALAGLVAGEIATPTTGGTQTAGSGQAAGGRWISAASLAELERRLAAALDDYHAREPLRPGMSLGALRGVLPENVGRDAAELALARLVAGGDVASSDDVAHRSGHRPNLGAEEQALVGRILNDARELGLEALSERDWSERLGTPRERLQDLLAHLKREGHLVRAPGDLWFDAAAVAALRERILAHFASHDRLETKDYKALIGTTRRTAVPLMEYFDDIRLTTRSAEARILRARGQATAPSNGAASNGAASNGAASNGAVLKK
jgi:selenocysteine-specific elongation factor